MTENIDQPSPSLVGNENSEEVVSNSNQTTTPTTVGPNRPTTKKFPVLLFFLLILLAVATAFSVYFFYQVRTMTLDKIAPSPMPSPVTSPDPLATWQTYSNTRYNYEIKYPAQFAANNIADGSTGAALPESLMVALIDSSTPPAGSLTFQGFAAKPKYPATLTKSTGVINTHAYEKYSGPNSDTYLFFDNNKQYIEVLVDYNPKIDAKMTFDQILSTFKFTDTTSSAAASTTPTLPRLTYVVPSGWTKIADPTGKFEGAYDPANSNLFEGGGEGLIFSRKSLNDNGIGYRTYMTTKLLPYDGGSKHSFIYKNMNSGNTLQNQDKSDTYVEKEYSYNGKTCLFLSGISLSQFPNVWGMCDAGSGQAFLITFYETDSAIYLQSVQTIKRIN